MRVRVKPGHITFVLSTGFGVSLLFTIGAMVLQSPAQPSASPLSAAPAPVTHVRTTAQVSDLTLAKHAAAVSAVKLEAAAAAQAATTAKPVTTPAPAVTTQAPQQQQPAPTPTYAGVLTCTQVENLWTNAGGPSSEAVLMAEIAGAESGRNPGAPYGGLWQIQGGQPVAGDINDPVVNAENAVSKYNSQGLAAWTTYTSGAYQNYPC